MNSTLIIVAIIVVAIIFLFFLYRNNFKKICTGAITLITGGVKTGKSLLSVELACREYKKVHRIWWFKTRILKEKIEEPLFYTNVVISFKNWRNSNYFSDIKRKPHKLDKNIMCITREMLLREERLAYKSVVYIQESSLCADSQEFTEKTRNCTLSLFNKLFGHETKGGKLFYDTQSPKDNHYSIKRVVSTFQFIQKSRNFILFRVLYIREMVNSELAEGVQNNVNEDIDFSVRKYIIWRWWYKKYDRYYFSYITDNLEVSRVPFVYHGVTVTFSDTYNDFLKGLSYKVVCNNDIKRSIERELVLYKEKTMLKNKIKESEVLNNGNR